MKKYFMAIIATMLLLFTAVSAIAEDSKWDDFNPTGFKKSSENTAVIDNESAVENIEEKEKGRVKINIGYAPNVGISVFNALQKSSDVSAIFSSDDYVWVFKGGKEVATDKMQYNLGLKYSDPLDFRYEMLLVDDKAKLDCVNFYKQQLLPFEGEVTVETKIRSGEKAYVYTYNKEERKAEVIAENLEVSADGEVTIPVTYTKDMFITNKPLEKSNII